MEGVFLEGVPDSTVAAGGGEVVACWTGGGEDGGVGCVYCVDEGGGGEEVAEDEYAGTGEEDVVPFVLEGGRGGFVGWRVG